MDPSAPGFPVLHYLPEFAHTHVRWVSDAILPSHPLFSPFSFCLQSPSVRVFSNELALCRRWPKYWSYSFNIHPSNEFSGLISFRIDWFHLFAIQETLKSLLHHHNLKASILWHSAVFMVQLSHPYMNTGTIALTIWTFVGKVMALFFTMLSKYVTAFLLRSKHLLTLWLQSLEPKKITSAIVCTFPPPVCHEVMGPDAMIFVFECWVLSQLFHSLFSSSSRGSLVPLHFLPREWSDLRIWGCCYTTLYQQYEAILIPAVIHPAWHFTICTLHRR